MFLPLIWASIGYGESPYLNPKGDGISMSVSPTHKNEEMDVPLGSQPKKELTSASYY